MPPFYRCLSMSPIPCSCPKKGADLKSATNNFSSDSIVSESGKKALNVVYEGRLLSAVGLVSKTDSITLHLKALNLFRFDMGFQYSGSGIITVHRKLDFEALPWKMKAIQAKRQLLTLTTMCEEEEELTVTDSGVVMLAVALRNQLAKPNLKSALIVLLLYALVLHASSQALARHNLPRILLRRRRAGQMIEDCPPFLNRKEIEVAKPYVDNERPPFQAPVKHFSCGLQQ
ncbi:probable serine/threonine-protein kinase at4g35230 [Phtheirospermum japonicum]|uniref:Probable serine/threonine-protein kinase at4g35230 n=1 Tax=Phtheirospermum japonicum TaxID=374723 RepID=A0A830B3J9_9LAMI|nr:probable serine/threonine-protein kinase at4g35230 [Phtheirospermum japonicum]